MTERMSVAQARAEQAKPKRSKYNAQKTVVDGITFDSKREAAYYADLKIRERAGEITDVVLQPPYPITGPRGELICMYKADFQYVDLVNKCLRVVDVKGVATPVFKLKRKMMKVLLGVEVEIVK